MATGMNMSIYGLYRYDNTLFDDMLLPDSIDRDTLVYNLVMDCAELTALYPSAEFMKEAIAFWSQSRIHAWSRMEEVLYEDYDPFINIKRDEVRTITQNRNLTDEIDSTNFANAWNNGSKTERESNTGTGKQTGSVTTTEHFHLEGDSAITDAQDVAVKEMKMRNDYDLYKYIINDFKNRFCLHIYY